MCVLFLNQSLCFNSQPSLTYIEVSSCYYSSRPHVKASHCLPLPLTRMRHLPMPAWRRPLPKPICHCRRVFRISESSPSNFVVMHCLFHFLSLLFQCLRLFISMSTLLVTGFNTFGIPNHEPNLTIMLFLQCQVTVTFDNYF